METSNMSITDENLVNEVESDETEDICHHQELLKFPGLCEATQEFDAALEKYNTDLANSYDMYCLLFSIQCYVEDAMSPEDVQKFSFIVDLVEKFITRGYAMYIDPLFYELRDLITDNVKDQELIKVCFYILEHAALYTYD